MHKMRLVADKPFHNNCDVNVYHVQEDGKERKRCKIKLDYAECDIRQLQKEGYNYAATLKYFDDLVYNTVKRYIADDWEYEGGHDEIMAIVEGHIKKYFYEEHC